MLPTLPYINSLNSKYSKHTRCISCSQPKNQFHWLYCTCYNNITQIIQNTITQFAFSEIPDITALQIQQLRTDLFNHNCLNPTWCPSFNTPSFSTTFYGFISIPLIDTISRYSSYKIASNIAIKILLKIFDNIYDQLWKPYCTALSQWKNSQYSTLALNTLSIPTSSTIPSNSYSLSPNHTRLNYTYSCRCGLPDQLHDTDTNSCPPLDVLLKKLIYGP